MRRLTEQRGSYRIAYYVVDITPGMKEQALDFSRRIILSDNQYSRLLPREVWNSGDVTLRQKIEIQRTYMGKLGELAFAAFLREKGKAVDTTGMFEIYEGQNNVDNFDFVTREGKLVDVKTGFRAIHRRLLINVEQFDQIPKDYYVAVWLNAADTDAQAKLVDWDTVTAGTIVGYAEYRFLQEKAKVQDFGEGPARCRMYNQLLGIDGLAQHF